MLIPVDDPEKLKQICDFINEMLADDTDVIATPNGKVIAWKRVFPGKGEYHVTQNEAFMRIAKAGHNPAKMIGFAQDKFDPTHL